MHLGTLLVFFVFLQVNIITAANAPEVELIDMQDAKYTGELLRASPVSITLKTVTPDTQSIIIPLEQIKSIIYKKSTIKHPITLEKIKSLFSPKAMDSASQYNQAPATTYDFSRCYNEKPLLTLMDSIDSISDSAFIDIQAYLENCRNEMDSLGIIDNPCDDKAYQLLHLSDIAQLSGKKFKLLQQLHTYCFEFQDDVEWDYNLCADSVFKKLKNKHRISTLSRNERTYLRQLRKECKELRDDLDDEYISHWRIGNTEPRLALYDESHSYKTFTTIGSILLVPGIILPIAGAVTIVAAEPDLENLFVLGALGQVVGWFIVGVGVGCDCAAISLLSIGAVKYKKAEKFQQLKDEYQKYKQQTSGLSLYINIDF